MLKRIAVAGAILSVVAILGAGLIGSALAQTPTPTHVPSGQSGAGAGRSGAGMGQRMGRGAGGPVWGGEASLDVVSKLTGLTADEIRSLRQDGQSLSQIAQSKGVAEATLINEILAAKKAALDAQVAAGTLTQAQADAIYENMDAQVKESVTRTTTGPQAGVGMSGVGQAGQTGTAGNTAVSPMTRGKGKGMMGAGAGGPAWGGQASLDVVSKLTGLTVEEIRTLRQDGRSLSQIAQSKGISEETLIKEILAAKKTVLDAQVSAGTLTQAQADLMYKNMSDQVKESVTRTTTGPNEDRGSCVCTETGLSDTTAGTVTGSTTTQSRGMGKGRMGGSR